jgi:hypothetical protein
MLVHKNWDGSTYVSMIKALSDFHKSHNLKLKSTNKSFVEAKQL